uniref:Uncharacterized protein n=1 Tax=Ditylenchus dipsaci TaxID=166011 RepID=A0A915E0E7_9BILA
MSSSCFLTQFSMALIIVAFLVSTTNCSDNESDLKHPLLQKRFYSWEEGKRSAPFADQQHRSLRSRLDSMEDPWKRTLYAWANAKKSPRVYIQTAPSVAIPSQRLPVPRFYF